MSTLKIAIPTAATEAIPVTGGLPLEFTFDPAGAHFERSGNNLNVTFDSGSKLELSDFFAGGEGSSLPALKLPDGTEVDSGEFLQGLNPDFDITTASGSSTPGSGGTSYSDDAGALTGGIDRLGDQGTDHWDRNTGTFSIAETRGGLPGDGGGPGLGGEDPGPGPNPSGIVYQARAVLYTHGAEQGDMTPGGLHEITVKALTDKGGGWAPGSGMADVAYEGGCDGDYIAYTVNADGTITFALTEEGLAFMRAQGKEFLDFYFTIRLPDGSDYTMQVVIADDRYFNSNEADQWPVTDDGVSGRLDEGGLVHGEWHQGAKNGGTEGYDVDSSRLGDELSFSGGINALDDAVRNAIRTNEGADTVTVNGDITARGGGKTLIDTEQEAGDNVTVNGGLNVVGSGLAAGQTSENTIISTDVTIKNDGPMGMWAQSDSTNRGAARNVVDAAGDVLLQVASNDGSASKAMNASSQHGGIQENRIEAGGDVNIQANVNDKGNILGYSGDAYALYAEAGGGAVSKNTVTAAGDIDIAASSWDGMARGMSARGDGADNTVTSTGGSVDVSARTEWDTAFGLEALNGGKNTINAAGKVNVEIKDTEWSGYGLYADGQGSANSITGGGIDISVSSFERAMALLAQNGGSNSLVSSGNVDLTAKSDSAYGIGILSRGGTNTVTASGSVNIEASSGAGNYEVFGLQTDTGGTARITGNGVNITTRTPEAYTNNNIGVGTFSDGQTLINAGAGSLVIDTAAKGGTARGLSAESGGSNTVTASGGVKIDVYSGDSATGMHAAGGSNSITSSGNVDINAGMHAEYGASRANQATGLNTEKDGSNSIIASGNVTVTALSDAGQASAIFSRAGSTSITSGGTVTLTADSERSEATGIKQDGFEWNAGLNKWDAVESNVDISAQKIAISATGGGGNAIGIWTKGSNGRNQPEVSTNLEGKEISIDAVSDSTAYGIYSENESAYVNIKAQADQASRLTVNATGDKASGLLAYGPEDMGGKIFFTGGNENDTVSINATGKTTAAGIYAVTGKIVLDGGAGYDSLEVSAVADGFARGMDAGGPGYIHRPSANAAFSYSNNEIRNFEDIDIRAKSNTGEAVGMFAAATSVYRPTDGDQEYNKIFLGDGGQGKVNISAEAAGRAVGMYAAGSYDRVAGQSFGYNEIHAHKDQAADISINASSSGDAAYGMWGRSGGYNKIAGGDGNDTISVSATAKADAYGMYAVDGDATLNGYAMDWQNYIDGGSGADKITIEAESTGSGNAYALFASKSPGNLISASGTIDITAEAANGKAYAMYADNNGRNIIVAGEGPVQMTIFAEGKGGSYAMYAGTGSTNRIVGSDQGDRFSIKGDIVTYGSNSSNEITAGAGNDTIVLDGKVSNTGGKFTIDGGDGWDILVLKAASLAEFWDRYGAWLSDPDSLSNIDAVHFEGLNRGDIAAHPGLNSVINELEERGIFPVYDDDDSHSFMAAGAAADDLSYMGDGDDDAGRDGASTASGHGAESHAFGGDSQGSNPDASGEADPTDLKSGATGLILDADPGDEPAFLSSDLSNAWLHDASESEQLYISDAIRQGDAYEGEDLDVLHLDGPFFNLSDLSQDGDTMMGGFDALDLTGGDGTTLTVDGLLSNVSPDMKLDVDKFSDDDTGIDWNAVDVVRVTGDTTGNQSDAVILGDPDNWLSMGTVVYDSVEYTVWQNQDSADASHLLMVQQGLMI